MQNNKHTSWATVHDADRNIIASNMRLKARLLLSIHTSSEHTTIPKKMVCLTVGVNQAKQSVMFNVSLFNPYV
jgi:predicted XRE-type DNA-binding protein